MPDPLSITVPLRVRYAECDAQGIAFNAHYLAWFDLGITELWREALGSYADLIAGGIDVVVAEATVRYRAPARFDDVIDLEVTVASLGTTAMTTAYVVRRDGDLLADGEVRHVFVDTATWEKTPAPAEVRRALGFSDQL